MYDGSRHGTNCTRKMSGCGRWKIHGGRSELRSEFQRMQTRRPCTFCYNPSPSESLGSSFPSLWFCVSQLGSLSCLCCITHLHRAEFSVLGGSHGTSFPSTILSLLPQSQTVIQTASNGGRSHLKTTLPQLQVCLSMYGHPYSHTAPHVSITSLCSQPKLTTTN